MENIIQFLDNRARNFYGNRKVNIWTVFDLVLNNVTCLLGPFRKNSQIFVTVFELFIFMEMEKLRFEPVFDLVILILTCLLGPVRKKIPYVRCPSKHVRFWRSNVKIYLFVGS